MLSTHHPPHTFADVVRARALEHPTRHAYTFLKDGAVEEQRLTYGELDRRARAVAASLRDRHNARALLLYAPGLDFVVALAGCWYAGVTAIPAYPPQRERARQRFLSILADAQPSLVLTTDDLLEASRLGALQAGAGCRWVATDRLPLDQADDWQGIAASESALALLQYTSGSTGDPKGVMVSHANLLANERMIATAMDHDADSTFVSWLPMYHDMGLIGNLLQPLYIGASCYLMSPLAFLQEPLRWLRAISQYRAHTSGAPDFAYELCTRRSTAEQRAHLDLRSWRVAYNGSEPVRAETLARFSETFAPCGFRSEAWYPCYGLAEATLLVSGSAKTSAPVVQAFDSESLKADRVVESAKGEEGGLVLVGCGVTTPGQDIAIVHPDARTRCGAGDVGEIWIRGTNVAQGYWGRDDLTAATFHAHIEPSREGPFLRTGDLGFLRGATLFVTGRLKDLVIIRGQNHYPHDIEHTVESSHPALRADGAVAFSIDVDREERLVVVAEIDRHHLRQLNPDAVIFALREAVAYAHEVAVYDVVLVKPGSIPKTSSGKRQRRACRERFLDRSLEIVAEWRGASSLERADAPLVLDGPAPDRTAIESWLVSQIAARVSCPVETVDAAQPPTRYGLDSLAAVELSHRLESSLGVAVPMAEFLGTFSIADVARRAHALSVAAPTRPPAATSPESSRDGGLSYGERALWFQQQHWPDSGALNIARTFVLEGALDATRLREAFQRLVDRHPALRTNFLAGPAGPERRIDPDGHAAFQEIDATGWDRERLTGALGDEANRPFDLANDRLLRVTLFGRSSREHALSIVVHHSIADLWSLERLLGSLGRIYAGLESGSEPILPQESSTYGRFVEWQAALCLGPTGDRLLDFWRRWLERGIQALNLPADRARPLRRTWRGDTVRFSIAADLARSLAALARAHGTTPSTVYLAALQALLYRYTGHAELTIGTLTHGRASVEWADVVGYFVNLLAVQATVDEAEPFAALLRQTRDRLGDALRHGDGPFPFLAERLQLGRDPSRPVPFDVMFVFQQTRGHETALPLLALGEAGASFELGRISMHSIEVARDWSQFDLTVTLAEVGDEVRGCLEFSTERFDRATIERLVGHFRTLLGGAAASPDAAIRDQPLLAHGEPASIAGRRSSVHRTAHQPLIHRRFEAVADRARDVVALIDRGETLSYGELNRRANRVARHLRRLGVGPEVRVAICIEPSFEMVIGLLGILKAGGVYVPLDPANPDERLAFILSDVAPRVLLTGSHLAGRLATSDAAIVELTRLHDGADLDDDDPSVLTHADNAAYVIYTSGSTGRPKGSIVTHRNVTRLFDSTHAWFTFDADDVWTLFHSYAFDFSVWEMWGALLHGGRLVVVPQATRRSPEAFYQLLSRERVTVLNQTPAAFEQLMTAEEVMVAPPPLHLRLVIFGGEQLHLPRLRRWFERHGDGRPRLVNMYGITETCVHVTYRPLSSSDAMTAPGSVIGTAIPDLDLLVLDRDCRPVPIGVPGELYVAGEGLARGYLNRPSLSAARFIPHPFPLREGERLYRTGDVARFLSNGDVEYLGRIDQQVKLRGFRIELGEIEAQLCEHAGVREAVVVAHGENATALRLVAYVVPAKDAGRSVAELRAFLKARLPGYMVPSTFVMLDELPLSPNGKVDRRKLPAPRIDLGRVEDEFIPPRSDTECALAEIWSEVLGVTPVGITDNFFDLGGDSIRSVQVAAKAKLRGLALSIDQIFLHQTIGGITGVLRAASSESRGHGPFQLVADADRAKLPTGIVDAYPLAMLQAGLVFHSRTSADYQVYVSTFRVRGPLDERLLSEAIRRLAARHAFFRTSFDFTSFTEPLQLVHAAADVPCHVEDLQHLSSSEQEATLAAWREKEKGSGFDWSPAPHARFAAHRLSRSVFQLTLSEPLLDGWSVANAMTDLLRDYAALLRGTSLAPPSPPRMSYASFVALERDAVTSPDCRRYWAEQLEECSRSTLDQWLEGGDGVGARVVRVHVPVPESVSTALQDRARSLSVPLKSVLLAAHLRVVSTLAGEEDVITGLVANGRPEEDDADRVVGLFLNTVPFRQRLRGGTWSDLVRTVWSTEQQQVRFRRYPLAQIQKEHGGQPLFDTVFNYTHFHVLRSLRGIDGIEILDADASDQTYFSLTAQFNLDLQSALVLALDCRGAAFPSERLTAVAGYYTRALTALATTPDARYDDTALLGAAEWAALCAGNGRPPASVPPLAPTRVAAQAAATPAAVAVRAGTAVWTYAQLQRRAAQWAAAFQARGLGPEPVVAVGLPRTPELLAVLLGGWQAGAAYLPLDPAAPVARLAALLGEAAVSVAVADRALAARLGSAAPGVAWLTPEAVPASAPEASTHVALAPAQLAYVLTTSGSTGTPKGVALEHRQLAHLLAWAHAAYPPAQWAGVLAGTALSFDLSLFELFGPLTCGGTVVLADDPLQLPTLPARDTVRLINTVPSVMAELLQHGPLPSSVQTVNLAGEPLRRELVAALAALGVPRIVDLYGPTEATTYATAGDRTADGPETIGRPLPYMQVYLLDAHQQPVPPGVGGEIYLGGAGVARGYLRRPGLTAAAFVPDPWSPTPGARLYRTGDRGRWRADGQLVFLGRPDTQVKLRGFRIELGEIEAALRALPAVQAAVVTRRTDPPAPRLVAYLVLAPGAPRPTPAALRQALAATLPGYMLPAHYVVLDTLPRTPTGKLDRRALPAPSDPAPQATMSSEPEGETERLLATIWADTLGRHNVGRHDNFFDLGGDSLLSLQIVARANQAGLALSHKQIFEHQTISGLAATVAGAATVAPDEMPESGPVVLTPIQHWLLERHLPNPHHWNQAVLLECTETIDVALMQQVVDRLFTHHDALRLRFAAAVDGWRQFLDPPALPAPFTSIDMSTLPVGEHSAALESAASHWQTTLDLTRGPLARVVHFDLGAQQPPRLLLVVHHLAVDGLSWRILLEDIQQAYRQLRDGLEIRLPARTTSFKRWAERLVEYAGSSRTLDEWAFWTSDVRRHVPVLPADFSFDAQDNTESSARMISVSLTTEETRTLLQELPQAYQTHINDVLLAALVETLSTWTHNDVFLVNVEGHGREPIADDIDLTRTVGWFTAIFPVVLRRAAHRHIGELVASVKAQLHAVPNRGIGYGVLAYLSNDPAIAKDRATLSTPQLSFNYMGQFQQVLSRDALFRLAGESVGATHEPSGLRHHLVDVRASIYGDRLQVDWIYSDRVHREETMRRVADLYVAALREIIRYASFAIPTRSAVDSAVDTRPQRQVDELLHARPDLETAYPLAPLQAGMLFHALYSPGSTAYTIQLSCNIDGDLDVIAFERAWQTVVQRHAALRTSFPRHDGAERLQAVHRRAPFAIHVEDWRHLPGELLQRELDAARRADRAQPFDLEAPPLCRLALFRTASNRHECIWSYHHLVMDGWSAYVVLQEVFAAYGSSARERANSTGTPSFAAYIEWLERQDPVSAAAYWRATLDGATRSCAPAVPVSARASARPGVAGYGSRRTQLSADESRALREFARQNRFTLNTLVQGVWAVVLSRYHQSNDVVFGVTVNGRPPDLPGVETTVGVFINTVPLRVRTPAGERVDEGLARLQRAHAERAPFEHAPLSQIQTWHEPSARSSLFDTILVFEYVPPTLSLSDASGGLRLSNIASAIDEHYPLVVVVQPDEALSIELKFDRGHYAEATVRDFLEATATALRLLPAHANASHRDFDRILTATLDEERARGLGRRRDANLKKLRSTRGKAAPEPMAGAELEGNE